MTTAGSEPSATAGAFERFAHDAAFRDAFRRQYRGSAEPADAAWWLSHPDSPAPSGALPPTRERDRLSRLMYTRDGAEDPELRARVDLLSQSVLTDAAAALAAYEAADTASRISSPVDDATPPEQSAPGNDEAPGLRKHSWLQGRLAVAALAVGCLMVGALGGHMLAGDASARSPVPASSGLTVDAGFTGAGVGEVTLTELLDRPQSPGDLPPVATGRRFDATSFRRLRMWDAATAEGSEPRLYVGRDVSLQLCLATVVNDAFIAQCLPNTTAAGAKSTLNWSVAGSTGTVLWSRTQVTSLEVSTTAAPAGLSTIPD